MHDCKFNFGAYIYRCLAFTSVFQLWMKGKNGYCCLKKPKTYILNIYVFCFQRKLCLSSDVNSITSKIHLFVGMAKASRCQPAQSEPIHQFNVKPLNMSLWSVCIRPMMGRHFQGDLEKQSGWVINCPSFSLNDNTLFMGKQGLTHLTMQHDRSSFGLCNLVL